MKCSLRPTSNERGRKNRNIGGTACTIKRAGVVNDSALVSCADSVFGAFFGGSASHQRVFFMAVFFQHAASFLQRICVRVAILYACARRGQKHLVLDFCVQASQITDRVCVRAYTRYIMRCHRYVHSKQSCGTKRIYCVEAD